MALKINSRGQRCSAPVTGGAAAVLIVLIGVLGVLGGCSGQSEGEERSTASTSAGTGVIEEPRAVVEPTVLHQYFLNPVEYATVSHAVELLTADCVNRFGFEYTVPEFTEAVRRIQESENESDGRLYGITDSTAAKQYGYMPASLYETEPTGPETPGSDSAAFNLVFSGGELLGGYGDQTPDSPGEIDGLRIPPGGCLGDAWFTVAGTYNGFVPQLARQLWIQLEDRTRSDSRRRTAVSDWSSCLAESGYRVTDPLRDEGDIQRAQEARDEDSPATTAEVKLALADIACKEKVDLVKRLNSIDQEYAKESVEKNQLALHEERERLDTMLKNAGNILEPKQS